MPSKWPALKLEASRRLTCKRRVCSGGFEKRLVLSSPSPYSMHRNAYVESVVEDVGQR